MPVYEFECAGHGRFDAVRKISERTDPVPCPTCGTSAQRIISAPRLATMDPTNRKAWARNEKSAHEPRRARKSSCGHVHADGSSCSSKPKKTALQRPNATGRPWMLGH